MGKNTTRSLLALTEGVKGNEEKAEEQKSAVLILVLGIGGVCGFACL